MGTGILDVIGGPHDFLPPRSDGSDEFKKNCNFILVFDSTQARNHYVTFKACTLTTTPQMWLILQ
jgi:hypothetical protein